jgi:replicative DNA helicase
MAPSGIGKSWFLSKIACSALQKGKNVLHYSLELSESYVGQRYTTILTGIQTSEHKERKDEIIRKIKGTAGRVRIKYYPPQFASSKTIAAHIEKLKQIGFSADLIIIDYADLLKSGNGNRDGLYAELGGIYEELRGLSGEAQIPIWTASQSNREGSNADVVGLENMSEAYGKAMVADVVLSLSRKAAEKSVGVGRVFVAKNRAGRDGILYPMRIDTSMSRFTLIENAEEMSLGDAMNSDASDMRSLLKKKWKEINDK